MPASASSFLDAIIQFSRDNKALLMLLSLPVLLALLALASWRGFDYFTTKQRMSTLSLIDDHKARADKNHTKTLEFLKAELAKLNAQDPTITPAKNELQAQIDAAEPDYQQALQAYEAFFGEHPSSDEGQLAGIQAAMLHLAADHQAEALKLFTAIFDNDDTKHLVYEVFLRPQYAALLEEAGQVDQALAQINILLAKFNTTTELTPVIQKMEPDLLYAQVRLATQLGEAATAAQATDRLVQRYPTAEQTRLALTVRIHSTPDLHLSAKE